MISLGATANLALIILCEIPARPALANALHGLSQTNRQASATLPITFQQMEDHSLGCLWSYAWQNTEGIDQQIDGRAIVRLMTHGISGLLTFN
jgi:hypothetical protein